MRANTSSTELYFARFSAFLNFSTKLLREDPTGITRLHGKPEELTLGTRTVRLYPIFHPAAALYTPRMLETLREDFSRLPELLALAEPKQPHQDESGEEIPQVIDVGAGPSDGVRQEEHMPDTVDQLGLF